MWSGNKVRWPYTVTIPEVRRSASQRTESFTIVSGPPIVTCLCVHGPVAAVSVVLTVGFSVDDEGIATVYHIRLARNSLSSFHVSPSGCSDSPVQWNEFGVISVNIQRVGVPSDRAPNWTISLPLERPICSSR